MNKFRKGQYWEVHTILSFGTRIVKLCRPVEGGERWECLIISGKGTGELTVFHDSWFQQELSKTDLLLKVL